MANTFKCELNLYNELIFLNLQNKFYNLKIEDFFFFDLASSKILCSSLNS